MKSTFQLLLIFFIISGCAYIEYTGQWPPSENIPPNELIYLDPNRELFYEGQEIKGVFQNTLSDTLYIVHPNGGGDSPLQKWSGNHWVTINTKPKGIGYTQSLIFVPLPRYKTRTIAFPENRLRELEEYIPGKYRFSFLITSNKHNGISKTVISRPFVIKRILSRSYSPNAETDHPVRKK